MPEKGGALGLALCGQGGFERGRELLFCGPGAGQGDGSEGEGRNGFSRLGVERPTVVPAPDFPHGEVEVEVELDSETRGLAEEETVREGVWGVGPGEGTKGSDPGRLHHRAVEVQMGD